MGLIQWITIDCSYKKKSQTFISSFFLSIDIRTSKIIFCSLKTHCVYYISTFSLSHPQSNLHSYFVNPKTWQLSCDSLSMSLSPVNCHLSRARTLIRRDVPTTNLEPCVQFVLDEEKYKWIFYTCKRIVMFHFLHSITRVYPVFIDVVM